MYNYKRQRHKSHNIRSDCVGKTIRTKKKVTCFNCGKTFTEIKDAEDYLALSNCHSLLKHIKEVHEGTEFRCPHCDKNFNQKWNRDRHAKSCPKNKYCKNKTKR